MRRAFAMVQTILKQMLQLSIVFTCYSLTIKEACDGALCRGISHGEFGTRRLISK